ncbi:MAG: WG repeat-containing protein [Bacteroidota bacterium]
MDDNRKKIDWKDIKVSVDWTHFWVDGKRFFAREFKSVLKFHAPGLAPVETEKGWSFIDVSGEAAIPGPFLKAWGFYYGFSAVEDETGSFHIRPDGSALYEERYAWVGNFQEGICTVCDAMGNYFHIGSDGRRVYKENHRYAGDFKDGFAAVMLKNGKFKHIDRDGKFIYTAEFQELGVFHKGYATARDAAGWMHIDLNGNPLYEERYLSMEPFYNGKAFSKGNSGKQLIVLSSGQSKALNIRDDSWPAAVDE